MKEKKQKISRENLKFELFEEYRIKNKLTKAEFCKLCDISCKTYNSILSKKHDCHVDSVIKILKVVNLRFDDLL